MANHVEVIDKAVAPTCTKTGLTEGKHCSACNTVLVKQQMVAVTNHVYENGTCQSCGKKDPDAEKPASEGLKFTLNSDGNSYSVTGIGTCTDTAITIPSTYNGKPVTGIGNGAFSSCPNLTSIAIPNSVINIGSGAFWHCESLTIISIPDSVTSIGDSAFVDCSRLASISVAAGNTVYHSSGNCLIHTESRALIAGCHTSVIPTDGSVTSIGQSAFSGRKSLTSITIPDGVTSVGKSAFSGCSHLTGITIPISVTTIGESVLNGCSCLTTITFEGTTEQWNAITKGGSWNENTGSYTLTCLGDVADAPAASEGLSFELFIDGKSYSVAIGSCTDTNIIIPSTYNGKPVTIIRAGAFNRCSSLTSITIPNSVTAIDLYAFYGCSSLTSISIPDSVTGIGTYAFYGCTSLTNIRLPDGLMGIGTYAFYGTAYYKNKDNWAGDVLYIGHHLVKANTTLSDTYSIKEGTKCIADDAFLECKKLVSITIPNSVTVIGSETFKSCSNLTSVTIGNGLLSIGYYAFKNCYSLTSISIPNSVLYLGMEAFSGCSGLTNVTIGSGVPSIGERAFKDCSDLTDIHFTGTKEQWNAINKSSDWDSNTGAYTIHCTDGDIPKQIETGAGISCSRLSVSRKCRIFCFPIGEANVCQCCTRQTFRLAVNHCFLANV